MITKIAKISFNKIKTKKFPQNEIPFRNDLIPERDNRSSGR